MKQQIVPLSARELAGAEREAKSLMQKDPFTRGASAPVTWAARFLRLLALHRATERQSVMLQGQIKQLQAEVELLEAERRISGELA